ncbi:MAG TPA: hypothetical protein VH120_02565 [Gemmataceae bacterium]|jgi:hypothetical protein|nr:hypothetical protein [Gemmataceae bacterium]
MAKKKAGIDFKQVLLQKGERYGFYAAAAILALFLFLGAFKAVSSESTSTIVNNFDKGVKQIDQKIARRPGDPPPPLNPVIYDDSMVAHIPFTNYIVRNDYYNTTSNELTKRLNPRMLSPNAGQVDFVHGSVETYHIVDQGGGKRIIAVLTRRAKTVNNATKIPPRIRKGGQPRPQPQPQNPQTPAAGPMAGAGLSGRMPGGTMPTLGTARSTDTTVEYKDVNDKDIDSAQLAETLDPQRMVIVTCTIPYRQQVEEYRRALRATKVAELSEYPEYRGYVVERRVLGLDGKSVEQDWATLDVQGTLRDLYSRTIDFEPENPPADMPADLKALYPRLVPPEEFELLLPRPKLYRGEYPPVNLQTATDALKTLIAKGEKAVEIRTQTAQTLDDGNPFHRGASGNQGGYSGGAPVPGGKGGGDGRPGMRTVFPGGINPMGPGINPQQATRAEDEDAWLLRFIDVTCEAGHLYQYRVAIKALNPNFQKPAKELAVPMLAEKEFLQSDFFEVPGAAVVPPEEYLYAATRDDRKNHFTEKMPSPGLWDETWVQMQRWYRAIRPEGLPYAEPFGEWLVADMKAIRGQYVGDRQAVILPLWSMENAMFLFRENPARSRPATGVRTDSVRRSDPSWVLDLYPTPPVLLVDFEGGQGQYFGPKNRPVQGGDVAGVEMLFLSADGKLRVARSGQDLNDAERTKRETGWMQWLEKVKADSDANRDPMNQPGGPPGRGGARDRG